MKRPRSNRWLDGKEFSYLVSWGCIVLASIMLFPVVVTSTTITSAKVTVCVILGIMFVLGMYSLIADIIDYLQCKKMEQEETDSGGKSDEKF